MRFVRVLTGVCLTLAAVVTVSAGEFPSVETVERQPLLSATTRLGEALETVGSPLKDATLQAITKLKSSDDDKAVAAGVQKLLDPLCLAAVEFPADGPPNVTATERTTELVEQGWRAYLIKVVNRAESTDRLSISSPNAAPLPHSPAEAVESRWLGLELYDGEPLRKELSGLPLEYRIVQLYSRDAGKKEAALAFRLLGEDEAEPQKTRLSDRLSDRRPPATKEPARAAGSAEFTFDAQPSTVVTFDVVDGDLPAMAAFEIRDEHGRIYPLQSKRLAPDFFFQKQIYRGPGEAISLPAGTYTVHCSRGPESIPETKTLVVGDEPVTLRYEVERWIDAAKLGYWSGDHHIHAAGCLHYENPTQGVHPPDMLRHCKGEDLKVGCCLTWGPCFDYQKRFFTGRPDNVSEYPYLIRYDIEVSGFGSHNSGHLNLIRLKEQIYPGGESKAHWPTLGLNTLAWAKSQGAVCGPAHSAAGLTRSVGRLEGSDGFDGPHRLPNYDIPAYDGIGANEFVVDITHEVPGPDGQPVPAVDFISTMNTDRVAEWNMWYHALNCGYRIKASGETDFPCITGERVGIGRVYAKLDGKLEFDRWVDAIAAGRSYVSDGTCHLIDLTARVEGDDSNPVVLGEDGSTLELKEAGPVKVQLRVAAYREKTPTLSVELIVNGNVADTAELTADGKLQDLTFDAEIDRSSWLAVRVFPHAHTNPIWVTVGGKPVRPSRKSVEWCLRGVEQCWSQKQRTYREEERDAAKAAYDHARDTYERLLGESLATVSPK